MPTPKEGYFLKDGTRVPSVTTILKNVGWGRDGLMGWAWKLGRDGKNLRGERDAAAESGTLAHAMLERYILGERDIDIIASVSDHGARTGYQNAREWLDDQSARFIATEVRVVSEVHGYGGTLDAVGYDNRDRPVLFDWKASNGVHPEYIMQIAAYGVAWAEVTGQDIAVYKLCRFDRKTGIVSTRSISAKSLKSSGAFLAFLAAQTLHQLKADIEALTR